VAVVVAEVAAAEVVAAEAAAEAAAAVWRAKNQHTNVCA
jgi:hypothetical protein